MLKRIWIAGNSGSGKTTLANLLAEKLGVPVYHRDYITWHEDFTMRTEDEQVALTREITETDKWIFEGARFTASKIDGRLERCDTIINLERNRFLCAYRAFKRARRKMKRMDLSAIDKQPFTLELLHYTLWGYPGKWRQREEIFELARGMGIEVIIIKSGKDITRLLST